MNKRQRGSTLFDEEGQEDHKTNVTTVFVVKSNSTNESSNVAAVCVGTPVLGTSKATVVATLASKAVNEHVNKKYISEHLQEVQKDSEKQKMLQMNLNEDELFLEDKSKPKVVMLRRKAKRNVFAPEYVLGEPGGYPPGTPQPQQAMSRPQKADFKPMLVDILKILWLSPEASQCIELPNPDVLRLDDGPLTSILYDLYGLAMEEKERQKQQQQQRQDQGQEGDEVESTSLSLVPIVNKAEEVKRIEKSEIGNLVSDLVKCTLVEQQQSESKPLKVFDVLLVGAEVAVNRKIIPSRKVDPAVTVTAAVAVNNGMVTVSKQDRVKTVLRHLRGIKVTKRGLQKTLNSVQKFLDGVSEEDIKTVASLVKAVAKQKAVTRPIERFLETEVVMTPGPVIHPACPAAVITATTDSNLNSKACNESPLIPIVTVAAAPCSSTSIPVHQSPLPLPLALPSVSLSDHNYLDRFDVCEELISTDNDDMSDSDMSQMFCDDEFELECLEQLNEPLY